MVRRNRGTIGLSEEGLRIVQGAVCQRGWTQGEWASTGYTSVSTVKRLLKGSRIESKCFHSLLNALGLEVIDSYIKERSDRFPALLLSPQSTTLSQYLPGIFMTATFTEDKRQQVERILRHLKSLLIDSEVDLSKDRGAVIISGSFCQENREHIEMTVEQLDKIFTSCKITW